ncbi:MAG: hypothetical protein ABW034_13680 [Steroidobacteraceae bacterium]
MPYNPTQFVKDLSVDFPYPPEDVPLWTEHYMFFGYDAAPGVGLFLHLGRETFDHRQWRINVMVYLPNEELMVVKCRGPNGHARGPGAGPVRVTCIEPGQLWLIEFDGAAQRIKRRNNNVSLLTDGTVEQMQFSILLEGAAPLWTYDALKGDVMKDQSWGKHHFEQICSVRGDFNIGGKRLTMNGSGIRDHSPGARDYAPVVSDFWINGLFPSGKVFNATHVRCDYPGISPDSPSANIRYAYILDPAKSAVQLVDVLQGPPLNDLQTPEKSVPCDAMAEGLRNFTVVLKTPSGQEQIEVEVLHSVATTYVSPSEELIGTDLTDPNSLQLLTCPARFRWNGEVGYGIRERIARIHTLKR